MVYTSQTRYEYRTSRAVAAVFGTEAQAREWLERWKLKSPKYAESLQLTKVTTTTLTEVIG